MRKIAIIAASSLLAVFLLAVLWGYLVSWKPGSHDVLIVNTSSPKLGYHSPNRPWVSLVLEEYDYDAITDPWRWKWSIEFLLENRHKEDLQLNVYLEIVEPDPRGSSDYRGVVGGQTVLARSKRKTEVQLSHTFTTLERDMIPQGTYRIWAKTEIEVVKRNNEVKTYRFEWELGEGHFNRTDYLNIPEKVRGENP